VMSWDVCGIMTGMGRSGDRSGSQCFNYNGLLLVPRNEKPESSPKTSSSPFPTCLVQMSKIESLPKEEREQEVTGGPQSSLVPTCPPPASSVQSHKKQFTEML